MRFRSIWILMLSGCLIAHPACKKEQEQAKEKQKQEQAKEKQKEEEEEVGLYEKACIHSWNLIQKMNSGLRKVYEAQGRDQVIEKCIEGFESKRPAMAEQRAECMLSKRRFEHFRACDHASGSSREVALNRKAAREIRVGPSENPMKGRVTMFEEMVQAFERYSDNPPAILSTLEKLFAPRVVSAMEELCTRERLLAQQFPDEYENRLDAFEEYVGTDGMEKEDRMIAILETITDEEIRKKVEGLVNRYNPLDCTHFPGILR